MTQQGGPEPRRHIVVLLVVLVTVELVAAGLIALILTLSLRP